MHVYNKTAILKSINVKSITYKHQRINKKG